MLVNIQGKNKDPNPVYAEMSAYNWPLAVYSEIFNSYTNDYSAWKDSLDKHFQNTSSKKLNNVDERKVFQNIFHGIVLGSSIRTKFESNYFNYADLVGTISDFYYALYNLFNSVSMARDVPQNKTHGKNINNFKSIRAIFPYPYNIHSYLDNSNWDGKKLINKSNFLHDLNILPPTSSASSSLINTAHSNSPLSSWQAQDILQGYLRGTVDYYIWGKTEPFKAKKKLTKGIRKQDDKNEINKQLANLNISFMDCLYRYRTKAHYRDFSFLAYQFQDSDLKENNYMNIQFYKSLYKIIEFSVATSITHTKYKLGKNKTQSFLSDISNNIKDKKFSKNQYWEQFSI